MSHEQVHTVVILRLETGKSTIPGVGCRVYAVWWFPTAVRIRLSQPPAGDWLAGAWAELGNVQTTSFGFCPAITTTTRAIYWVDIVDINITRGQNLEVLEFH